MTFDLFFRGLMICFAAAYGFALVRALRSGRWPEAGRLYARTEAPHAYWREIGFASVRILLAVTALLFMPQAVEGGRDPPYGPAICFILFAPGVIRVLWTGEIEFGSNNRWGRRDRPYWVMALIGLLLVASLAFFLVRDLTRG